MKMLDERLATFHTEIMAMVGAYSLNFLDLHAYGAPEFFGGWTPLLAEGGWRTSGTPS